MKKLIFEFSPLMAILLVLSLAIPVGITVSISSPALALADNVTINSPTTGSPAYSKIGGLVTENISIGISGATAPIDVRLSLLQSGATIGTPTNYLIASSDNSTIKWYQYDLVIPAGTSNGTYDIKVEARHAAGSGGYTSSSVMTGCVIINSTHVPASPSGLLPASGSCYPAATPTFSWTAVTETSYTFTYNFQLATNTSFSPTTVSLNQAGVSYAAAGLTNGTYYWRVQAQDQYGNTGSWTSAYSMCIDLATPTDPTPLLLPTTGSTISGSYNPTYSWTASTDTAACANIRYFVETYSNVGLTTLVDNVTGVANPSVGSPSVTPSAALGAGTYWWRVKAYDCAGHSSAYIGPFSYTIPASCTTYAVSLGTGWNLVSLPLCPSSASSITPAQLLALCDNPTAVQIIWGYEASSSAWQYYIPSSSSTLTSINVAKGYWIQTSAPANINITGTSCPAPPQSLITSTLYPGWNLVGYKSCTSMASNLYFPTSMQPSISFICSYSGGWNCFAPGATILEPRKGYWVFWGGTTNGTYGLPCN